MAVDITKHEKPKNTNLGVVNLEKKGASLSLDKKQGFEKIVINLNWNQLTQDKRGFLSSLFGRSGSGGGLDLDLGCLYERKDGRVGCIQALGDAFGDYTQAPHIHLLGDDRTGENAEGEFLWINGNNFNEINRVLIYAFIYEGAANWAQTDGVITLSTPGRDAIKVILDSHRNLPMCAIAMIENNGGDLKITKLVDYFDGHEAMDDAYGFGLSWHMATK